MTKLLIQSWLLLAYFDYLMRFRGFQAIHLKVRKYAGSSQQGSRIGAVSICQAIDLACVFYFKRVLCLQRSAATTILLRRHGWPAKMVIGAQLLPFQSHAWVELNGEIVNDKPYITETFQPLDYC